MARLRVRRNQIKLFLISVKEPDGVSPFFITPAKDFIFLAKDDLTDADADALITLTLGDGIEITDIAMGEMEMTILPEHTSSFPDEDVSLQYELWMLDTGDATDSVPLDFGTITIRASVRKGA